MPTITLSDPFPATVLDTPPVLVSNDPFDISSIPQANVSSKLLLGPLEYLRCDDKGNCCNIETNTCEKGYVPGMDTAEPFAQKTLSQQWYQIQEWIKNNPMIAIGVVGGLFLLGSKKGR